VLGRAGRVGIGGGGRGGVGGGRTVDAIGQADVNEVRVGGVGVVEEEEGEEEEGGEGGVLADHSGSNSDVGDSLQGNGLCTQASTVWWSLPACALCLVVDVREQVCGCVGGAWTELKRQAQGGGAAADDVEGGGWGPEGREEVRERELEAKQVMNACFNFIYFLLIGSFCF